MHELVIVVSDLYLSQEAHERQLPPGVALPGLQHAARFGTRAKIAGGWRSWLARWLIADRQGPRGAAATAGALANDDQELLRAAPATVAAAALMRGPTVTQSQGSTAAQPQGQTATRPPSAAMPSPTSMSPNPMPQQPETVWMATPVHLVAGLTSVHLDRRGVLRLSPDDLTALATEFGRVFHDSGFVLEPLDSGGFLLFAPQMPIAQTSEPALLMGNSIADAQPVGAGDPALRRLGAEVEMWLHEHPVNDARRRRGEAPVTGLWLWGGGPSPSPRSVQTTGAASSDIAFGRDAYLEGLWASMGKKVFPLPQQLTDVFGYPQARRAAVVIEIGLMLHSNPRWTFFDAVAQIDRAFIAPAVEALSAAKFTRLVILANDRELALRARDHFKLWRRIPPGLSGLQ